MGFHWPWASESDVHQEGATRQKMQLYVDAIEATGKRKDVTTLLAMREIVHHCHTDRFLTDQQALILVSKLEKNIETL